MVWILTFIYVNIHGIEMFCMFALITYTVYVWYCLFYYFWYQLVKEEGNNLKLRKLISPQSTLSSCSGAFYQIIWHSSADGVSPVVMKLQMLDVSTLKTSYWCCKVRKKWHPWQLSEGHMIWSKAPEQLPKWTLLRDCFLDYFFQGQEWTLNLNILIWKRIRSVRCT